MAYFNYFPEIVYDVRGVKNNQRIQAITNILVRVRKKLELTNIAYFDQYFVTDGDRPDTLAYQIYGDSELHWVILYANYMTNPYYDWPLTSFDLQKYIAKKYSSNINGTHHWEDTDGYEVDETASGATAVTNYVYEEKKNDAKRSINIIKQEYLGNIIKEFKKLVG